MGGIHFLKVFFFLHVMKLIGIIAPFTSLFCINYILEGVMNESRSHPNDSDFENKMTKKGLQKIKVTIYTNEGPPPF